MKQPEGTSKKSPKPPKASKKEEHYETDSDSDEILANVPMYPNVKVQATESYENKKKPEKKLYKKLHFCYFCGVSQEQIIRHITKKHSKEPIVKKLEHEDTPKKERDKITKLLKNKGNFKKNIEALQAKEGTIIVVRRPAEEDDASKFIPCNTCYGFFSKYELYRHHCIDGNKRDERNLLRDGRILLASAIDETSPDLGEVLGSMLDDEVSDVAKADPLIRKFMNILLEKHDSKQRQHTRQKARDIARLLLYIRKNQSEMAEITLRNLLVPSNFDIIIKSVNELCQDTPSLPLKLGQIIPKVISILEGESIRSGDTALEDSCKRFKALMEGEWSDRIALKNRTKLRDRKLNQAVKIPSSEDVIKFCESLEAESNKRHASFKKNPGIESGRKLAEAVLTEIITFNMRRGGEASRIETKLYQEAASTWENRNFNDELYCSLNETQKANAEKHFLVKIIGKCGTHVPCILTYKMKEKVDTLLQHREKLGIPPANKFLFGVPGYMSHLKSWDILRKFCEEFQVSNLTSTSMRKYLATCAQALNFSDKDVSQLARHLGHTVAVHNKHYRHHLEVIEVGKIATMLHATQQGVLHLQKDATLDTMEAPNWDLRDTGDDIPSDGSNEEDEQPMASTSRGSISARTGKAKRMPRAAFDVTITYNERKQILEFFKALIEDMKLPGEKQCQRYITEHNSGLAWVQVKSVVHSRVQCLKKARAKDNNNEAKK